MLETTYSRNQTDYSDSSNIVKSVNYRIINVKFVSDNILAYWLSDAHAHAQETGRL